MLVLNPCISRNQLARFLLAAALLATASGAAAQTPFACTGEAFIVQDSATAGIDGQLTQIDQSVSPFDFMPVGGPQVEYNNIGFNAIDGFIYGLELTSTGNNGVIQVDSTGTITNLMAVTGTCSGGGSFPSSPASAARFDAGDVSDDGTMLFTNAGGTGRLWILDITTDPPSVVDCPTIFGGSGRVNDWAYNPADGNLYGGDRDGLQVARLDLDGFLAAPGLTIARTDFSIIGAIDGTGAFGGAWFNALGSLFLYRNGDANPSSGRIFEITDVTGGAPTMIVADTQSGAASSRNDGAACAQDAVGAAKSMSTSDGMDVPATITIDYVFENFATSAPLTDLSALDDLVPIFGTHGVDWTFGSISSVPASLANPAYNGHAATELFNQAPTQSLVALGSGSISVAITLLTTDGDTDMDDEFCNQIALTGLLSGVPFGDTSTDGLDPDPNMDGVPDERDLACITQLPVELQSFSIE